MAPILIGLMLPASVLGEDPARSGSRLATNRHLMGHQMSRAARVALVLLATASMLVALLGLPVSVFAEPPPIPTTLTISADPDPAWVGDTVTWTFQVTPIPDGGHVTLGGPGIPVDPETGIATMEDHITLPGSPTITAWYQGTDRYLSSAQVEYQLEVNQHPVLATLDVPDEPVGRGDPFDVIVDLDEIPDGGRILIQPMLEDGPAQPLVWADVEPAMPQTITVPGQAPGDYQLRAFFEGTNAYTPATSATLPIHVFDRVATATLEIEPTEPDWGEQATATVTFDPVPDDGGAAKLLLDGGDAGWFEMDWEAGTGTVAVPWEMPGSYTLDVGYIPAASPPRWVHSSTPIQLVVGGTAIDQDPPVGTVTIAGGAAMTMDGYVVVSMEATDASPIHDVAMSCDGVTFISGGTVSGDWGWGFGNETCDPNDGVKTIYVRWTDMYSNVGIASDSIVLEANGPLGSVAIANGAATTATAAVQVSTGATDAGSGVSQVALSNDGATWTTRAYAASQPWTLTATPGTKTVRVKWKDNVGHWSAVSTDTIVLDQSGPTGSTSIAGGAAYTKTTAVTVATAATDTASGLSQVALSNDGTTWTTRPYAASQSWTLSSGNGTKTVRVKWKDAVGNWSAVKTDTIVLDTVAPTVSAPRRGFVAGTGISAGKISLRVPWSGSDATSGIARYELAQSTDGGAWTTVSTTFTGPTATRLLAPLHTYRFRVRAIDKAGNTGAWATGATFRISRYSEFNSAITYSGSWTNVSSPAYWGGAARKSSTAGAKASLTFTGRSIAWVARTGPDRGKAQIYINGTHLVTVDLYSATAKAQRVVWVGSWTTAVSRKVTIRVAGTSGRPRIDLDALVTAN